LSRAAEPQAGVPEKAKMVFCCNSAHGAGMYPVMARELFRIGEVTAN